MGWSQHGGRRPRAIVEWIARTIGSIRYIHYFSGSAGDSSRLHPTQYIRQVPFGFDQEAIYAIGVEIGAAPSVVQLKARIEEHAQVSGRLLMRGHDVSAIVATIVRCCGGACGQERIEQLFRLGFTAADLAATTVYAELREWEMARTPRRVLA